ncbi:MAG: hypothetical protein ACK5KU_01215 [Beutenbergiaceae bacterium]
MVDGFLLRLPRAVAIVAVLCAALIIGTGCGPVRLETQAPEAVVPDEAEQRRQAFAIETRNLERGARLAAAGADPQIASILQEVADDAAQQLTALGGLWRPRGRQVAHFPHLPLDAVLDRLDQTSQELRDSLPQVDPSAQLLYASIAINRTLRAEQLRLAFGQEPTTLEPALPEVLDPQASAPLIQTMDALGQIWEVVAAREEEPDAAQATAARWRAQAQEIARIAGVADTESDPRLVGYTIDPTDPAATIAQLHGELVPGWLAQVSSTSGADQQLVIDQVIVWALNAGLGTPGAEIQALMAAS